MIKKRNNTKAQSPFFTTLKGKKLQYRYIRAMIEREAIAVGLDDWVHPHTLRHSRKN